jgi:BlaI family transcriptional regulator, penicillinase repressor
MSGRKSSTYTEVELEFMQIIWAKGPLSSDDIQQELSRLGRDLADGSVRKILTILFSKGHVTREKVGRGFIYSASVVKEQADKKMVTDLLDRAFRNSVPGMVATLLKSREIKKDELDEIKEMIAKFEKENEND